MNRRVTHRGGFTLLELTMSLALVTVLLSILLPVLAAARVTGAKQECAANLERIGQAWHMCLADHNDRFPHVPVQTGWHYGGMRFSAASGKPFLDMNRPLAPYTATGIDPASREHPFECPADDGISGDASGVGTGERTAYRSFGTSYRANARLLDARQAGVPDAHRGLRLSEIATARSRMVLMGDPIWFEIREKTGRVADWHEDTTMGNLLFLDGSVKYMEIWAKPRIGPAVYEPKLVEKRGAGE